MPIRRTFMWSMIVSLSICAAAGIVVLLFPRIPYEGEVLGTAATVGLYSLLAMVGAIVIERNRGRVYTVAAGAGIALALLAMALVIYAIWAPWQWKHESLVKATLSATFLSINTAHLGLYAPARLAGAARWVKLGAVAFTSAFCVLIAILVWPELDEDFVLRAMGVLAILALLTSAVTPIAWKMQSLHHAQHATPTLRGDLRITLTCPRCNLTQSLPAGNAKCAQCRLDIRINIEEPRCACGYPFLGLRADHCPECGRSIPDADRWATLDHDPTTTTDKPPA